MDFDLKKIEDSDHLLDVLIQLEDLIDSMDGYVYANWIDGIVIKGPIIKRHWISFSLLYPYKKMPDPRFIPRLVKHGIKVDFEKVKKEEKIYTQVSKQEKKDNPTENIFWKVDITTPRRLLDQITSDLEEYDDDIDIEDVESAKDSGLDDTTQPYMSDKNNNENPLGDFDDASLPPTVN